MLKYLQLVLSILLVIGLSFLYYLHFNAQKLVYVDSNQLLANYKGMNDARNAYQKKSSVWKANIDTLAAEVENAIKDYEKQSPSFTRKEKELSRELIKTKQKQLADYQKALRDKAGQEDAQMTSQVLQQVNAYIKRYGEEHHCRIILAATDYGNIAYAAEGLDITDDILKGLNREYEGL